MSIEGEPKPEIKKSKAEELLEKEKAKDEFTKKRLEEIDKEYQKIWSIPEKKRTAQENLNFKILENLKAIKDYKEEFEGQKSPMPGIVAKDSIGLICSEKTPGDIVADERNSESVVKKRCFIDITKHFLEEALEQRLNIRANILAGLYKDSKDKILGFDKEHIDDVLYDVKIGEEKRVETDMSGIEVVFTKEKREPRPGSEIAKHPDFDPGHTEAVLIHFYDPEKRAKEIEEAT